MHKTPYPGLRPFKPEEHDLLFGQDQNLDDLFHRLATKRFVAVLGESGCGKSSLVRAGLIPMLMPSHEGAIVSWQVIVTQPGLNPISNLAGALQTLTGPSSYGLASIEQNLREDQFGLIRAVEQNKGAERKFLLVVVDQFEELFRFRRENPEIRRDDQAALYVKLLLNAAQREDADVYVLVTMRSEYLGEASQFYNLAEAISDGLFLLPRMKRVQSEEAIVEPALNAGVTFPPSIVQRLLNETEERQDGLPLLQHSLRRLWDNARDGNISLPEKFLKDGSSEEFVQWSLNDHLNEILDELPTDLQRIAAKVFKLLGERDFKRRLIRRPTDWREIRAISEDQQAIWNAIDVFRDEAKGRTFLVPSKQQRKTLREGEILDISHEVLLRRWTKYDHWLKEEADDSRQYIWLADSADRWEKRTGELLKGAGLDELVRWRMHFRPSAEWASRYTGVWDEDLKRNQRDYHAAMTFLDVSINESERAFKQKQKDDEQEKLRLVAAQIKKWKTRGLNVSLLAVVVTIAALLFSCGKARVTRSVIDYDRQIAIAKQEGLTMDDRVPAAIEAASLAKTSGIKDLEENLSEQIRLDQWELFSAVRKGESLNKSKGYVRSTCGVALDPYSHYVALADHTKLQVWDLRSKLWMGLDLPGIDCVKFSRDGKQLAISAEHRSANAYDGSEYDIKQVSFEEGPLKERNLDQISGFVALTFLSDLSGCPAASNGRENEAQPERIIALTHTFIRSYSAGVYPAFDTPLAGFATAAVPSSDGHYLGILFKDGSAEVLTLQCGKPLQRWISQSSDPGEAILSLAFSEDSSRIVTGSSGGWIWVQDNPASQGDRSARKVVGRMSGSVTAVAVAATPEKQELIAAGTNFPAAAVFHRAGQSNKVISARTPDARIILVEQGYDVHLFTLQDLVTWVAFANSGSDLLTASADQKARVFELKSGVEIERVPHESLVLFASMTGAGFLSLSQDADLKLTDVSTESLATRAWTPNECSPEASALAPGVDFDWAWACDGRIYSSKVSLDAATDDSNSTVVRSSMFFSEDGRALTWLTRSDQNARASQDQVFRIHQFRMGWEKPSALDLPSGAESPVMAVSPDHSLIAVAYRVTKGGAESRIALFDAHEGLRPITSLLGGPDLILSLAVSSGKSIAAGTVNNAVLYFGRQPAGWQPMLTNTLERDVEQKHSANFVGALAFLSDEKLLAGMADKTVRLLEERDKVWREVSHTKEDDAQATPFERFFLNADRSKFAAVGGHYAAILEVTGDKLNKTSSLLEPGVIEAVELRNDNTVVTSVAAGDSLTKITHDSSLKDQESRICHEQPISSKQTKEACRKLGYVFSQ